MNTNGNISSTPSHSIRVRIRLTKCKNVNVERAALFLEEVQVGKYQEKAQSEKDSHSKNRDGKKIN